MRWAPVLPFRRESPVTPCVYRANGDGPLGDEIGLAMYLADINGEDWSTWTPERRAQIENIALTAMAAVKETGRV